MNKITIAVGAETPIYLPLYLAAKRKFYGLAPRNKEFVIAPPCYSDAGVRDAVAMSNNMFGVCDPSVVRDKPDLVVIAALVTRSGFWIYCNSKNTVKIQQFDPDRMCAKIANNSGIHIITYPSDMTGYFVAKKIFDTSSLKEAWSSKHYTLKNLAHDADFTKLRLNLNDVLITANLLGGNHPDFIRVYSASKHPQCGGLLTTGVIAKNNTLQSPETTSLLTALQMALIEIAHKDKREEVADVLVERGVVKDPQIAQDIVRTSVGEKLFPIHLGIEECMWAKVVAIRGGGMTRSFKEDVSSDIAAQVYVDVVVKRLWQRWEWKERAWWSRLLPSRRTFWVGLLGGRALSRRTFWVGLLGGGALWLLKVLGVWADIWTILGLGRD